MTNTASAHLPDFPLLDYGHALFPSEISPHEVHATRATFQWYDEFDFLPENYYKFLDACRLTRLIARMYPFATREGLALGTQFLTWLAFQEDHFPDGCFARSPSGLAGMNVWFNEIMEDPAGTDHRVLGKEVCSRLPEKEAECARRTMLALADLMRRMADYSAPSEYMRFVRAVDVVLMGTLWETGHRTDRITPRPVEYVFGRRYTVGVPLAITLSIIADGYQLDNNEFCQLDMRKLIALAGNIWGMCDDITSYPKEKNFTTNELICYPMIMQRAGMTEQQAIDETARLHNESIARYVALAKDIQTRASVVLDRLIMTIGSILRGFYDYSVIEGGRYPVRDFYNDPNGVFPPLPEGEALSATTMPYRILNGLPASAGVR